MSDGRTIRGMGRAW